MAVFVNVFTQEAMHHASPSNQEPTMSSTHPIVLSHAVVAPSFMLADSAAALCCHLQQCSQAGGWRFKTAALGEKIRAVVAPRPISTVTGLALVVGVIALWA